MSARIGALLGWIVAASAAALAASIALPTLGSAVPAVVFAVAALVFGGALIPLTVLVRPVGRPIVALFGVGAGLLLLLAGGAALDPTPDVMAASTLLFVVSIAGLGILVLAAFGTTLRLTGSVGGLAMFVSVVPLTVDYPAGPGVLATGLAAGGLLTTAAWASAVGRTAARGRPIRRRAEPAVLADAWYVPMSSGVSRSSAAAGIALVVAVLAAAGSTLAPGLDVVRVAAEAVAGIAIMVFLYMLSSAAPDLGKSRTSGIWELVGIVFPVGRSWFAFAGALLLAFEIPIQSNGRQVRPDELAAGVSMVLGLSFGRLAWLLKTPGRTRGLVLAGAVIGAGALAVAAARSGRVGSVEVAALGATAALGGMWLRSLAGQLRGRAPVAVFRTPFGIPVDLERTSAAISAGDALAAAERRVDRPPRRPTRSRPARRSGPDRFPRTQTEARHDANELARRLGVSVAQLRAAQPRYRELQIPKRTGGMRLLHAPDPPTRELQRRILRRILRRLPVHDAAHGFERGRSIVSNAAPHAGRAVILKLDVADFFGRTRISRVRRYWRVLGWDKESALILTRLTTLDGGLPQGAPTSPRIANLVNVRLDARLAGLADALGARYTRYADDLTFSLPEDHGQRVRDLMRGARRILWREARYEIHRAKKLQVRRSWERQLVTGLVVNQRPRLPRETRRWLRAVEHRTYTGGQPTLTREQLRGWQALESMVDAPADSRTTTRS